MSGEKIDINKKYRTRDGREVILFTTESRVSTKPVSGEILTKGDVWIWGRWDAHGGDCFGNEGRDLVEIKDKHELWLNVYSFQDEGFVVGAYKIKSDADHGQCRKNRIACVKISFEEGEGLEKSNAD